MATAIRDDALAGAGLPRDDVDQLSRLEPDFQPATTTGAEEFERAALVASRFFQAGRALLERLPPRPKRSADEQAAADTLNQYVREIRLRFPRLPPPPPSPPPPNTPPPFLRPQ